MSVGIDIVNLKSFKNSLLAGGDTLKEKIFTKNEIEHYSDVVKLAGFFAIKEAFIKAVSDGAYKMNEIEVCHEKSGRPVIVSPKSYLINHTADLSVSHDGDYLIAICIINERR